MGVNTRALHVMRPRRLACAAIVLAFVPASMASRQGEPSSDAMTALQREIVGKLAGHDDIRPGVRIPNRFAIENKREARDYLAAVLTRFGLAPQKQDYSADGENLYAVLSCGTPSAEAVILGAHYDSVRVAPGANDDATGVAAVAAVAQALAAAKPATRDLIVVFFDEEERGLVGARNFAQMLEAQRRPVHSVHTIDQMGWDQNGNRAIELELPYDGGVELYEHAAGVLGMHIQMYTTQETGSDHQAFRRLGFQALGITEEYHHGDTTPYYHRAGDTYETVNFDYLASTTRLLVEVMRELTH
jgi:hypothetical protein